jgi:hypothetical protein
LHKAVAALWTSSGLEASFESHWASTTDHVTLNDGEAAPGTPFPYTVYDAPEPEIVARMSGHSTNEKHHIRDLPFIFRVFAQQTSTKSAKELASELAGEIMAVFGGHPTTSPTAMTLDNGVVLIGQYQSDYGVKVDDEVHQWIVDYIFKLDIPVAV